MKKKLLLIIFVLFAVACSNINKYQINDFSTLLDKAPIDGGFRMKDYWIWCGSCIKGDDGLYHLFASRWPKKYPFFEGYIYYSEIVHAVSKYPTGPYEYKESALPPRGESFWDGRMTHNPSIIKFKDTYYLYYIGSNYKGDSPSPDSLARIKNRFSVPAYKNIRIGVAKSKSLNGPWERKDLPILEPQKNRWDSIIVTNPAPCLTENGETYLVYRSFIRGLGQRLGIAKAVHPDSVYVRMSDKPISSATVEDPFIWKTKDGFYIIAKDMTGGITGESGAGVFLKSKDLMTWQLNDPPKAYSKKVFWSNGDTTIQGHLERPGILMENGRPGYLFFATSDGTGEFMNIENTWNMVIPLSFK